MDQLFGLQHRSRTDPVIVDAAYHQKRYHFMQSLWGMLVGLIPCLIGAGLYAWIINN